MPNHDQPPPSSHAATARTATPPPPAELDPRIQIELENLNTATDNINRHEIELEEANATFRILLNESTRRLKLLSKKLGACIDKSRPYHEAAEKSRLAQIDCQAAAVQFQRAHEHYAAAKETVALAEQRFMSGSHEWQFDNAWQEMLNHATIKVSAAEQHKAECNAEHQRRAAVFSAAEVRTAQLEDQLRRSVQKSRPYFEEKQICQDQLQTQKDRIQELQLAVASAKRQYALALKALEEISEEIHRARGGGGGGGAAAKSVDAKAAGASDEEAGAMPQGPREPGVGAERGNDDDNGIDSIEDGIAAAKASEQQAFEADVTMATALPSLNFVRELDRCDALQTDDDDNVEANDNDNNNVNHNPTSEPNGGAAAAAAVAAVADFDNHNNHHNHHNGGYSTEDATVEQLRQHVKLLAVRPMEGGDGQQTQDVWETELNATVDRLDRLLMQRESELNLAMTQKVVALGGVGGGHAMPPLSAVPVSMPGTPQRNAADHSPVIRRQQLLKAEPLPMANVSMGELPLLERLSSELTAAGNRLAAKTAAVMGGGGGGAEKRRRSLE